MAELSETFELVRVLATGGVVTAVVVQVGQYFRERLRGQNRVAEIKATSEAEIAKLEVELQLERERHRALTSSQLSIGPPPPG